MSLAVAVLVIMWVGLTAYALFGGADFGAGFWDLFAGGTVKGKRQRALIEHSIAPVWEANHVWLIFVLVVLWTAFPTAFAAIASTLWLPLTLAALGMIARGAAFAFRKTVTQLAVQRLFGAAFALSSVLTPFFLGTMAGGVASGRVPPGIAEGDVITSWLNGTSILGGVLAVGTCAYLAAVFLCGDAAREGETELRERFRVRALGTGVVVGAVALIGVFVLRADAPALFDGLTHRGLPLIVLSALAGGATMLLLLRRRYALARISASVAITAVIWGWAAAQYPYILQPQLTIAAGAADRPTLVAMLVVLAVGSMLLIPSLVFLYSVFQRSPIEGHGGHGAAYPVPGRHGSGQHVDS